jgi:hypothetical protein
MKIAEWARQAVYSWMAGEIDPSLKNNLFGAGEVAACSMPALSFGVRCYCMTTFANQHKWLVCGFDQQGTDAFPRCKGLPHKCRGGLLPQLTRREFPG